MYVPCEAAAQSITLRSAYPTSATCTSDAAPSSLRYTAQPVSGSSATMLPPRRSVAKSASSSVLSPNSGVYPAALISAVTTVSVNSPPSIHR